MLDRGKENNISGVLYRIIASLLFTVGGSRVLYVQLFFGCSCRLLIIELSQSTSTKYIKPFYSHSQPIYAAMYKNRLGYGRLHMVGHTGFRATILETDHCVSALLQIEVSQAPRVD